MKEGLKLVAAGMNPMDLKRGVDIAVTAVVKDIERRAKKVQFHEIRFQSRCLIGSRANALALGGSPTQDPIWYGDRWRSLQESANNRRLSVRDSPRFGAAADARPAWGRTDSFAACFGDGRFWRKARLAPWAAFGGIPSVAGANGTRASGRFRRFEQLESTRC